MQSSQQIAITPVSAMRLAQKVFPAPDMPTSASRNGRFTELLSEFVAELVME
jgi:hypothetical protein